MKKVMFVLVLAVALTMMLAATAHAEHSPSNFSQWSATAGTNEVVETPHSGYSATTVKCSVCHSVHRGAVMGQNIRNQVNGDWVLSSTTAPTEMLMRSSVANGCDYCHIDTALGATRIYNELEAQQAGSPQLYAGNSANRVGNLFDGGYGHTTGNACSYCHATHGAYTFKGAAASKAIKYTANQHTRDGTFAPGQLWGINPNVAGNMANHTFNNPDSGEAIVVGIQDEIYTQGNPALVDPLNKAQIIGLDNLIMGTGALVNSAVGASMKDVQVGAFCTTCHQTYASDSYAVVNVDQDAGLYGGTYGVWTSVAGFESQSGTWRGKGHPLTDATNDFAAQGSTLGTGKTVAWADADTCRKCHDAGTSDAGAGVVYSSWPHVTPGYYRFMGAGESAAEYAALGSMQADMVDDATGWLSEGETVTVSVSPTYAENYMLYPGQNYRNDLGAADQFTSQHLGVDGLCTKCHIQAARPSLGIGRSF